MTEFIGGPVPSPPSARVGQAQPMEYRQGIITAWNPATLANRVRVDGPTGPEFENLPVLGVAEAATYKVGAVVGIHVVSDSWAIVGRYVIPGTTQATDALAGLSQRFYTDFVVTGESCTSTTYTDLATVGPRVTIPVGASGRILIIATAQIQWGTVPGATTNNEGRFNVAFSGANSRTPNDANDPLVGIKQVILSTVGNNNPSEIQATTAQAVFTGLTPGDTTITMKYRNTYGGTNSSEFFRRVLTAIAL
jgi:hypothetical protein